MKHVLNINVDPTFIKLKFENISFERITFILNNFNYQQVGLIMESHLECAGETKGDSDFFFFFTNGRFSTLQAELFPLDSEKSQIKLMWPISGGTGKLNLRFLKSGEPGVDTKTFNSRRRRNSSPDHSSNLIGLRGIQIHYWVFFYEHSPFRSIFFQVKVFFFSFVEKRLRPKRQRSHFFIFIEEMKTHLIVENVLPYQTLKVNSMENVVFSIHLIQKMK